MAYYTQIGLRRLLAWRICMGLSKVASYGNPSWEGPLMVRRSFDESQDATHHERALRQALRGVGPWGRPVPRIPIRRESPTQFPIKPIFPRWNSVHP